MQYGVCMIISLPIIAAFVAANALLTVGLVFALRQCGDTDIDTLFDEIDRIDKEADDHAKIIENRIARIEHENYFAQETS